jgi:hypothetical protein
MNRAPLNEGFKLDDKGKIISTPWNQWFDNAQKVTPTVTTSVTGLSPNFPPAKIGDIHVDINPSTKAPTVYIGADNQSISGWVKVS